MKLEDLKDKKIVILGFGREGKDTFKFLKKLFPKKKVGIADQKFDKNYLKKLKDYDVVIKSPGIPFKIIPTSDVGKIITQTDIFFDKYQGLIVGVTGTKGKSTTASLIYEILKTGGIKTHLIGNIGQPVLSHLKEKGLFVYELSSHQLYNLKKSPHIAVLLNIYPEHLDYYRNFKEYVNAKTNITRYQTKNDYLVYNSRNKIVAGIAKKSNAKKIPIKGEYYELDRNAARAVGKIFNSDAQLGRSSDWKRRRIPRERIERAIKSFKPLPHRLELVGTFKGITFYDDALSTIPETAIYALDSLGDRVETIFLGGYDRGLKFENLAKRVIKSKIKNIILFPTTGKKIWQSIVKIGRGQTSDKLPKPFFIDNMRDAVKLAYQHTAKGKIALLSCASTSFSLFTDYREKGNLFKKYVKKFGA